MHCSGKILKYVTTIHVMSLKWTIAIYVSWLLLHYGAAHAYTYLCVPATWKSLLLSPFIVPTFHCTGLRWVVYTGGNKMVSLWMLGGAYILGKVNNQVEYEGGVD